MTINVALATFDAVVLGCDSLSSVVTSAIMLDQAMIALDADQQPIRDLDGNLVVALKAEHLSSITQTVFGGVNKMCCLYEHPTFDCTVGAVTAGQAILNGVTITTIAQRFRRQCEREGRTYLTVKDVAESFLAYMRAEWERDCKFDTVNEQDRQNLHTVQFLVGGYGTDHDYGKIFRLDVARNTCLEQFPHENHAGICWAGMANYAERAVLGFDGMLRRQITEQIKVALDSQRDSLLASVGAQLAARGQIPEGLELTVTERFDPAFNWDELQAPIDYANLPLQYGVELVALLVNLQSGMMRFGRGIPTVGGRTHIGVLRRGESFKMLNEADLVHTHVGYAHET